jgi:hypothetical protein
VRGIWLFAADEFDQSPFVSLPFSGFWPVLNAREDSAFFFFGFGSSASQQRFQYRD